MDKHSRRLTILRQLSEATEPTPLSELIEKLPTGYSIRAVRRLLHQLVEEGSVQKFGGTKGAKYLAVKKEEELPRNCFGTKSLRVVEQIRRPLFERRPVAYNDRWFDSYSPNVNFYLPLTLRRQLRDSGQRTTDRAPAGTYAHQIFNRLLIDLSYNSSRLEGNTYSLLETERLLLRGDSVEGKLDQEKVMILNHKEAIRYLVNRIPQIGINRETILTLHYLLGEALVDFEYLGKIRDRGVRIGGSTYIPFEDPRRLDLQFSKIIEKAVVIEDPFEQSLFLLIHLSYLQPFIDVNKRTARLSANIPLVINNLVPLSFNDVEVNDYISAMIAIYELQEVSPIVDLYLYSYVRSCAVYDATVKSVGFDEFWARYRQERRGAVRQIILKGLWGEPLDAYVAKIAEEAIPSEDREQFVEDVRKEIRHLDQIRIAGLGVTSEELQHWLSLESSSHLSSFEMRALEREV